MPSYSIMVYHQKWARTKVIRQTTAPLNRAQVLFAAPLIDTRHFPFIFCQTKNNLLLLGVTLQMKRRCFLHFMWRWPPPALEVYRRPDDVNFAENER